MQSLLGHRPIRPLSSRSPTLIGGLSAFCINSQIIRLQHVLFSSLQSFSLPPHLFHNSSLYHSILLSLLLHHSISIWVFSTSVTNYRFYVPPSLPPSIPCSSVFLSLFQVSLYTPTSSPLPPSLSHSLPFSNDRFYVIVCLSVKRPHHPV